MYIFQSERLGFREWQDADLEPMYKICADEEVMRYFPSSYSKEETLKMMERFRLGFSQNGFTFYAVELLETKKLIGFIGLSKTHLFEKESPLVEIGWRLNKDYWNMGLATEGAKKCLEFAKDVLKLKQVYSLTAEVNKPSLRVMEKIGMNFLKKFDHPRVEDGHLLKPHLLYVINL
ncbi:GNAT family N-acetyltransferase [Jiulongibacter sp. NS-SX5]|uniref:GNAT family N-acetyltransferase n=1 Tax=Jiulongibacter sp. NS-SX5 TaxID=3463854 RepID=UPI004058FD44